MFIPFWLTHIDLGLRGQSNPSNELILDSLRSQLNEQGRLAGDEIGCFLVKCRPDLDRWALMNIIFYNRIRIFYRRANLVTWVVRNVGWIVGRSSPGLSFLIFKQRKWYRKYFITVHQHFLQDIQGQCHSKDLCLFIERVETVKVDYSTSFISRKENDNFSALKKWIE